MENQLYEVVEVEGKNLGCVALKDLKKGTLILREKPQFSDIEASESDKIWSKDYFRRLSRNFQTMNPSDREKYLKLYSRHSMEELKTRKVISGLTFSDLTLKIHGIYETNAFGKGGVGFQVSRLVACPQLWSCTHYVF